MPSRSAGILLWRRSAGTPQVLLVHPGGPFWAKKDFGAWSIPKGEFSEGKDPEAAARREFFEELGAEISGPLTTLGEIRQAGGKRVLGYAAEGDFDCAALKSNSFEMEWPPRSGRRQSFLEVDRAEWLSLEAAREKILAGQLPFLDRLAEVLGS
jgi:predicted NUDIX family NTP pyrophosphohydrolase